MSSGLPSSCSCTHAHTHVYTASPEPANNPERPDSDLNYVNVTMSHTFCYLSRIAADLYVYQEQALEGCCWNRACTLCRHEISSKGEGIWHIRFIFVAVGKFSDICLCPKEVKTRFATGEISPVPHHKRSEWAQVIQGCITKMAMMVAHTLNVLHI